MANTRPSRDFVPQTQQMGDEEIVRQEHFDSIIDRYLHDICNIAKAGAPTFDHRETIGGRDILFQAYPYLNVAGLVNIWIEAIIMEDESNPILSAACRQGWDQRNPDPEGKQKELAAAIAPRWE